MSRGINKVILIGHLGADPDVRALANGAAVVQLSLATHERWQDKHSGTQHERTEWHRIVCFKRLAEIAADYLRKGSHLYIEGALRTRKWQDSHGQDRYSTEIVASQLHMLDSRSPRQPDTPAAMPAPAPAPSAGLDDDIPFAPWQPGSIA